MSERFANWKSWQELADELANDTDLTTDEIRKLLYRIVIEIARLAGPFPEKTP